MDEVGSDAHRLDQIPVLVQRRSVRFFTDEVKQWWDTPLGGSILRKGCFDITMGLYLAMVSSLNKKNLISAACNYVADHHVPVSSCVHVGLTSKALFFRSAFCVLLVRRQLAHMSHVDQNPDRPGQMGHGAW